jgi:hypothetical protein
MLTVSFKFSILIHAHLPVPTLPLIASLCPIGLYLNHSQVSEPDFRNYWQGQEGESGKGCR